MQRTGADRFRSNPTIDVDRAQINHFARFNGKVAIQKHRESCFSTLESQRVAGSAHDFFIDEVAINAVISKVHVSSSINTGQTRWQGLPWRIKFEVSCSGYRISIVVDQTTLDRCEWLQLNRLGCLVIDDSNLSDDAKLAILRYELENTVTASGKVSGREFGLVDQNSQAHPIGAWQS